ncbi:MAG: hypothetical protein FJ387_25760 [Verrucomicrobia bacterium]|nr:hypothetical protein [Verrucomicrobiota bacterium]
MHRLPQHRGTPGVDLVIHLALATAALLAVFNFTVALDRLTARAEFLAEIFFPRPAAVAAGEPPEAGPPLATNFNLGQILRDNQSGLRY